MRVQHVARTIKLEELRAMTPTALATTETRGLQTPVNSTPAGFDPSHNLPRGFMDFFRPLHQRFTPRQQELALRRGEILHASLEGDKPTQPLPSLTGPHQLRSIPSDCCPEHSKSL